MQLIWVSHMNADDCPEGSGFDLLCGSLLGITEKFRRLQASGQAPWWEGFCPSSLQALATVLCYTPVFADAKVAVKAGVAGIGLAALEEGCLRGSLILMENAAAVMELTQDLLMRGVMEGQLDVMPAIHCSAAAKQVSASAPMHVSLDGAC